MHTRHWPRHVLAAPPAHFSGIYVTALGGFYTGDGWRAALMEQRMSELHRREGVRGMRKRRARGTEIMLQDFWVGGNLLPTNETSPSKTTLAPSPVSLLACLVLSIGRPCTSTSGIDSLAILPLTTRYLRPDRKKDKKGKERKKERKGSTDDSAIGESERQLYVLSTKSGSSIWSRITNIWTSQNLEIVTKFREREKSRNSSYYDIREWKWHTPFEEVNQISYVATGQTDSPYPKAFRVVCNYLEFVAECNNAGSLRSRLRRITVVGDIRILVSKCRAIARHIVKRPFRCRCSRKSWSSDNRGRERESEREREREK